jgi:hypothetical protein
MIDATTRITPKFKNSTNFKNILDFLTTYDEESLEILSDMNNLDSQYSIVLDEIGKSLGVYPRPIFPKTLDGFPLVFTLDISQLDTVPFATDGGLYRKATNQEYSKILRVFARGINFRGTVQKWEDILFDITGAKCIFSNQASRFGITVLKDLGFVDKKIVEYVLRYNSLTVSLDYIGTTSGAEPFRLDSSRLDEATFVTPW